MRISDWSSDVCSSDLPGCRRNPHYAWPSISIAYSPIRHSRNLRPERCCWRSGCNRLPVPPSTRVERPLAASRRAMHLRVLRRRSAPRTYGRQKDRKSTRLNPVTNAHLVCRLLLEKKKHYNTHSDHYIKQETTK